MNWRLSSSVARYIRRITEESGHMCKLRGRSRWLLVALVAVLTKVPRAEGGWILHKTIIKRDGSALQFQFVPCGKEVIGQRVRLWRIEVFNKVDSRNVVCR